MTQADGGRMEWGVVARGTAAVVALAGVLLAAAGPALGAEDRPFLHPLFSHNTVLQRDMKAPVWGWTAPGAKVTVTLNGKTAGTVAGQDGRWQAGIGPFKAGGPYTLLVTGPQSVTSTNVLVGDVWVCSGQSNMEFPVGGADNAAAEIAGANQPQLRLFTVPKCVAFTPRSVPAAAWQPCTPATVGGFSAVGYFFGRNLNEALKVPVGLINSSWGGTIAEAWTSAGALEALDDFKPAVAQVALLAEAERQGAQGSVVEQWFQAKDPGTAAGWFKPETDAGAWKTADMPAAWEGAGLPDYDGVVWFQRAFEAPAAWVGKELTLCLGPIDDMDVTWVNGVKVGQMEGWTAPRVYKVPAAVVVAGRNVIAIRVLDTAGAGGITGQAAQMRVFPADDEAAAVPLAGPWRMQASAALAAVQPVPSAGANNPNVSTVLYNGMIAPLLPYAIKGAIWYQGESNAGRAYQYRALLPALIHDWRKQFGVGDFGFHIVSLANFLAVCPTPRDNEWAELREAQAFTAGALPNCGVAMAIDIGDAADIHPRNKQEVGRRLALSALATTYGQAVEGSGPTYRALKVVDAAIHLSFDHVGGGLVAKGDKLTGFAIAEALPPGVAGAPAPRPTFVWADAVIRGDTIVVSSPQVTRPAAVRYGWDANPVCNLYNRAGLPAVPFRTDDWPGLTAGRK